MIRSFSEQNKDYVIEAHCRIYAEEYQFDHTFAAFINDSIHDFVKRGDQENEHLWLAEIDNKRGVLVRSNRSCRCNWNAVSRRMIDENGENYWIGTNGRCI
ncbi:hypothetical protein NQ117_19650 [Paenibacillus sp. SC116]|uniref:hypothetical protein n=1 Tax=Paenibacillus sp. SC116 TaxID=2968986 RepID=UPI00215A3B6E|nr:hypothetical protein [Paenibacillus sp. SC116]MCR8845900.1 hypothetical protein [Paenibacillus sp. SC116]